MTTTLAVNRVELSKQQGDYWASASTSAGAAGGTTIIDTALAAKLADWIPNEAYDLITEAAHAAINEERLISSLVQSTGTLTMLAHSVQIGSGVDYEVHRLFTPAEKMRALVQAARQIFPYCYKNVRNETLTSGNWLRGGDLEVYTATVPDNWTKSGTITTAQNTDALYRKRGASSLKLTYVGAGTYIYQDQATIPEWFELAGKSVTFGGWGWASVASQLRLQIYDGTTTSSSDYHTGGSAMEYLYKQVNLPEDLKELEVRVLMDAAGSAYIDDLRLIGGTRRKLNIADLGIVLNFPHRIYRQRFGGAEGGKDDEPWVELRGYTVGSDGYLYLPSTVPQDYKLRVVGMDYLDFGNGTAWTDTIDIDSPQTDILIAQAIVNLCQEKVIPIDTASRGQQWEKALAYWMGVLKERKSQFAMPPLGATVHFTSDFR